MARFAKGRRALAISDRSGAAFPYREMVKEWNGAFVHNSEFEPKQPQLEPHPVGADPQGLMNARPARTEFPVQDFLSNNPFSNITKVVGGQNQSYILVRQIGNGLIDNEFVRFQDVKTPMEGGGFGIYNIGDIEQSAILTNDITATATTINITPQNNNFSVTTNFPTPGFVVIEKVNATTGRYDNEVISYTGTTSNGTATGSLTGCVRGTSTAFRGFTPSPTTASIHLAGARLRGSRPITLIPTTFVNVAGTTITETNSFEALLTVGAWGVADGLVVGGGLQCTYGPINDRA
ncbi:unnamed protein product [marine sediment metagenome]|uniref:Uncharacterized protein n=1 Tax=marine sediment metagenome TaxID=412755 RepID=X1A8N6_9ZZZZ